MEVKNCKMCKHLFNSIGGLTICPICSNILEDKFKQIKEYIRDNKGVTVNLISEKFDIPTQQIKKWIKEERLVFSEDSIGGIECEACGTYIKTGRFCNSCKTGLLQELNPKKVIINTPSQNRGRVDNKMRFLNKNG